MSLLLVNYHYIRDPAAAPYPGIYPLAPAEFAAQVRDLAGRYHMATPAEAEQYLLGQAALPRPSVLLTFDDGLREQADAARTVLDPLGITAVFFVTSQPLVERRALTVHKVHWLRAHTEPDTFRAAFEARLPPEWAADKTPDAAQEDATKQYIYDSPADALLKYRLNFLLPHDVVDRAVSAMLAARGVGEAAFCDGLYMSESEMRGLVARGHLIGAHGHSHAPFARLGARLDADVRRNVECLTDVAGQRPAWVSYPYGREWAIPDDARAFCRRHGFRLGVTLLQGWNGPHEDPALIKRINTNEVGRVAVAA